ncbi:Hypothetical_protein [Hexamita inflata]|uniref:Hypothetical_protein n=1 Tax=Hexamita inflata TaxID=28002 RepID=A0ABP1J6E3_9EUKA
MMYFHFNVLLIITINDLQYLQQYVNKKALIIQSNKTQTQIFAVNILQRVNEPEQEETDQRFMTLFPDLNIEALRVAADTLIPRFIPAIPKIATKITSEVNNVSSSAELTQVV